MSAASAGAARNGNTNYKSVLDLQTELLTQALLKLDMIEGADDRARRREQIKRVHEIQVRRFFVYDNFKSNLAICAVLLDKSLPQLLRN